MLAELAGDLRRRGVDLLIARDIGQVRDLLDREAPDPALQHVYPTVQAAVDAATARDRPTGLASPAEGDAGPPRRLRNMAATPIGRSSIHE